MTQGKCTCEEGRKEDGLNHSQHTLKDSEILTSVHSLLRSTYQIQALLSLEKYHLGARNGITEIFLSSISYPKM